jgi:hypothetical protein
MSHIRVSSYISTESDAKLTIENLGKFSSWDYAPAFIAQRNALSTGRASYEPQD